MSYDNNLNTNNVNSIESYNSLSQENLQAINTEYSIALDYKEKEPIQEAAEKVQTIFDHLNIEAGDFLARLDTNKGIVMAQKMIGQGVYAQNTHIVTVVKLTADKITIFHSGSAGVHSLEMSIKQFVDYVNNGIAVLKNRKFQRQILGIGNVFFKTYVKIKKEENGTELVDKGEMAGYSYSRVITSGLRSSKDTRAGRRRTLSTLSSTTLMNSNGTVRRNSMCSEMATEILKIAQINNKMSESDERSERIVTEKELAQWQVEKIVVDLNSKRTTPAEFVKTALSHGFQYSVITKEEVQAMIQAQPAIAEID